MGMKKSTTCFRLAQSYPTPSLSMYAWPTKGSDGMACSEGPSMAA